MKDIKEYNHKEIEKKHAKRWFSQKLYHIEKPKDKF